MKTEAIDVAPLPTAPGPIVQPPKLNRHDPVPGPTVNPFWGQPISAHTDATNVLERVHARQIKGGVLVRTSSRSLRNGQMQILSESTVFVPGKLDELELKPKGTSAK